MTPLVHRTSPDNNVPRFEPDGRFARQTGSHRAQPVHLVKQVQHCVGAFPPVVPPLRLRNFYLARNWRRNRMPGHLPQNDRNIHLHGRTAVLQPGFMSDPESREPVPSIQPCFVFFSSLRRRMHSWRLVCWRIENSNRRASYPFGKHPVGRLMYTSDTGCQHSGQPRACPIYQQRPERGDGSRSRKSAGTSGTSEASMSHEAAAVPFSSKEKRM